MKKIMKEFIAKGTIALDGVTFYIKAKSLDDAWVRFLAGHYDSYETAGAEPISNHVVLTTIEENS